MKTRAALATGQLQPLSVETLELDGPREGEVLIELKAAGLCHTDRMLIDGSRDWAEYPIVLGHEGAGVVRELGRGVVGLQPDDHVIPVAIPECGNCPACRSPKTNLCVEYFNPMPRRPLSLRGGPVAAFRDLGTFSQFMIARDIQVAKIRRDAPLDLVCCMGCAGITGLGAVLHTARVEAGTSVAVFGLGGIGLNVVEGARIAGATTIIGIDTNPLKAGPARVAGMTHFVNAAEAGQDVVGLIRDTTGGGADYSFECVGAPSVLRQAIECTRTGWGTTVMIGVMPGSNDLQIRPRALQEGRRLTGSFLGNVKTRSQFPAFIDWYVEGKLTPDNLISHRISLEEINKGFDLLKSGHARRVVIDF